MRDAGSTFVWQTAAKEKKNKWESLSEVFLMLLKIVLPHVWEEYVGNLTVIWSETCLTHFMQLVSFEMG